MHMKAHSLSFLLKHKWATIILALALALIIYFYQVFKLAFAAERIELFWANTIKEQITALQKEIPFSTGDTFGGCNYFALKKCVSLSIGTEAHGRPEIFFQVIAIVTRPCDFLVSHELDQMKQNRSATELSDLIYETIRTRDVARREKAEQVYRIWRLQEYFGCSAKSEERQRVVLNVVENLGALPVVEELPSGAKRVVRNDHRLAYQIVKQTQ